MKNENIAAIILVILVLCISLYMLLNREQIKETTELRGPVGLERD
ncbi:MAG: hypothetical protein RLZZ455_54 [Candidatus Parcubacteria bacterium]|jgi:predicted PurR-regulated permease PerM